MSSSCPYCNAPIRPNAKFCGACDRALPGGAGHLADGVLLDNGHYRVERPVGKGRMDAVFLASDTIAYDRPCIIKEIMPLPPETIVRYGPQQGDGFSGWVAQNWLMKAP